MIVKVSKVMAKFLNENLNLNCVESVSYGECDVKTYERYIDMDYWKQEADYLINKNKFKYLQVNYKDECYASPTYLNTNDLIKAIRRSDRTAQGFCQKVAEIVEI